MTFTSRVFLELTKAHYVHANIPAPHHTTLHRVGRAEDRIQFSCPVCHGNSIHTLWPGNKVFTAATRIKSNSSPENILLQDALAKIHLLLHVFKYQKWFYINNKVLKLWNTLKMGTWPENIVWNKTTFDKKNANGFRKEN